MTRDDIIRMAHEAGILEYGYPVGERVAGELERFADLIAEAEREACANINFRSKIGLSGDQCYEVSEAIRARSTP